MTDPVKEWSSKERHGVTGFGISKESQSGVAV
jgi:hypothetical protein